MLVKFFLVFIIILSGFILGWLLKNQSLNPNLFSFPIQNKSTSALATNSDDTHLLFFIIAHHFTGLCEGGDFNQLFPCEEKTI